VGNWTTSDFCAFYQPSSSSCPSAVVAQYRNRSFPNCPPSCVQKEACPAAIICDVYAALSLTCSTPGPSDGAAVTLSNITTLSKTCLNSYGTQAQTLTFIKISGAIAINGVDPKALATDAVAQQVLINATAMAVGGNKAHVEIVNISSSASGRRLLGYWQRGSESSPDVTAIVTLLVTQTAEKLGYSPNTAAAAAHALVSIWQTSVVSGSFAQSLQAIASMTNSAIFSEASVSPTVQLLSTSYEYIRTDAPSSQPTASPSNIPTRSPTIPHSSVLGGSSGSSTKATSTIIITVVFVSLGVTLCLSMLMYIYVKKVYGERRLQHVFINTDKSKTTSARKLSNELDPEIIKRESGQVFDFTIFHGRSRLVLSGNSSEVGRGARERSEDTNDGERKRGGGEGPVQENREGASSLTLVGLHQDNGDQPRVPNKLQVVDDPDTIVWSEPKVHVNLV